MKSDTLQKRLPALDVEMAILWRGACRLGWKHPARRLLQLDILPKTRNEVGAASQADDSLKVGGNGLLPLTSSSSRQRMVSPWVLLDIARGTKEVDDVLCAIHFWRSVTWRLSTIRLCSALDCLHNWSRIVGRVRRIRVDEDISIRTQIS